MIILYIRIFCGNIIYFIIALSWEVREKAPARKPSPRLKSGLCVSPTLFRVRRCFWTSLFCNHLFSSTAVHSTRALSGGIGHCRIESSGHRVKYSWPRWSVAIIVTYACEGRVGSRHHRNRRWVRPGKMDTLENVERRYFVLSPGLCQIGLCAIPLCDLCRAGRRRVNYWL